MHAKKIEINIEKEILMHIDGEPYKFKDNIEMNINESSLNVIVP